MKTTILTKHSLQKVDIFDTIIKRAQEIKRTFEFSPVRNTGFDVDLHNGCELDRKTESVGGVDYNEERRWLEHCYVICGGENISTLNKETVLI